MHETPLATSSPIRSKIKQMGRRKAKNSRRSISLVDVSAIDANPEVSSQISESNETLASGYRDSGYVRSEASSLEEDDSKASKDLTEELKFKDVLICELQESNRGLRLRCADAENKILRLRIKCQSHCACCQVKEVAQSPTDSAGEDKDEAPTNINSKYDLLSQDLFRFKRTNTFSSFSNDLNLSFGHDRLANSRNRLANSFAARGNASAPDASIKPLTRSKSSGTIGIGTQTPLHRSLRRTEDQAAEKLFALKVQQWQKDHLLKGFPADGGSVDRCSPNSSKAADLGSKHSHTQPRTTHPSLPHRTSKLDRTVNNFDIADGEASLLSVISERESSLEVDPRKAFNPVSNFESYSSPSSPEGLLTEVLLPQSTPFADITNQRKTLMYDGKSSVQKTLDFQQHSIASPYISDLGVELNGHSKELKDQRPAKSGPNTKFPESVPRRPGVGCESFDRNNKHFASREKPCGHCMWAQPSPVIIVPAGCCSCCRIANTRVTPKHSDTCQHSCEAPSDTPRHQSLSQLKLEASTDSSDLHPIFEMKSKTYSASGKSNFSATSEFDSRTDYQTTCGNPSAHRDCKCSPACSGLCVPLAKRFDAKAEYKRKIEEGMKKFASDARAETESLSFQPWTSPDSPEMSPLMKRLAESSHYVNQMAIAINRIATRFQHVTGAPNPAIPSP